MIVATLRTKSRDLVLEYHHLSRWSDWGLVREGSNDTFVYLGKFCLVQSALPRAKRQKRLAVVNIIAAILVAGTLAQCSGFTFHSGGYINGPH